MQPLPCVALASLDTLPCCSQTPQAEPHEELPATMTKADLAAAVHAKLAGLSRREAAELVDLAFEVMKETLERGEDLKVSGFGKWSVRDKRARLGRNPQSGERITISARRVVGFQPSAVLRERMNGS